MACEIYISYRRSAEARALLPPPTGLRSAGAE